jgi:hypothetical protein
MPAFFLAAAPEALPAGRAAPPAGRAAAPPPGPLAFLAAGPCGSERHGRVMQTQYEYVTQNAYVRSSTRQEL